MNELLKLLLPAYHYQNIIISTGKMCPSNLIRVSRVPGEFA